MRRDPDKLRDWQRRSAEKAQANAREKAMQEGRYRSMQASREAPFARREKPMNRHAANTANRKRRADERLRIYGGAERIAWMKARPCVVCGQTPSDCAHIKSGGMGRKADARFIIPLCRSHHTEQHAIGVRSFEARHGIDLHAEAARTEAAYAEVASATARHHD